MKCYNDKCPICFIKPDLKNDIIIVTPCKHYVCFKCLCEGAVNLKFCPLCRHKLTEAYAYKNNVKLFTFGEGNYCPHCVIKRYLEKSELPNSSG